MTVLSLRPRRVLPLAYKECLQILRDPSVILIAFVLPVIMLFLFAYAVSLDVRKVPIGLVVTDESPKSQELAAAFSGTRYFVVHPARDSRAVRDGLLGGDLRGLVMIPSDFEKRLHGASTGPLVEIITDGSQPNTANFVANYAQGVVAQWLDEFNGTPLPPPAMELMPRYWFNPEIESRRFLVPGAIAVVMTIIGTLLTALVVAREWERGTMEALLSTPVSINEIILGKLLPYFVLGLCATLISALLGIHFFNVPLRGSWFALMALSSAFLLPALGQGLLISTLARNQFIAGQMALFSGFLPAFLLSGFLFEIESMPLPIRIITFMVPARYFVASLQTIFLAGDVWPLLLPHMAALCLMGGLLFGLVRLKTRKSLEP